MDELHIAESANEYGISKDMRIEDGNLVTRHTYDAQPMLEAAAHARTMSDGRRWGDGQFVGIIPFAELTRINETHSGAEARKHAILSWLRDNPKLVTFDKFLKR